jgi:hypothetical protein
MVNCFANMRGRRLVRNAHEQARSGSCLKRSNFVCRQAGHASAIVSTVPPAHAAETAERIGVVRPAIHATLSRFFSEANDGC